MDTDLFDAIKDYASNHQEVKVLDPDEAERLRNLVADHFCFPKDGIWWWQSAPGSSMMIPYEGTDGLERLLGILRDIGAPAYLFITDDEPAPWPCVSGHPHALVDMVREQRFFEYFVVDPEMKWIIFDTHHNSLVCYGNVLALSI
jgi:hypothetical protein